MSYVFNMVGGSGGGSGPSASDAILTVTVPTGSTVTATKGGVTLTPTMWVQAADPTLDCALFVIASSLFDSVNAWTVTATLGTDTASDTVTIDSNEQYDMRLSYHVPIDLYQEVEYIENTGNSFINFNVAPAVNFKAELICCATAQGSNYGSLFGLNNDGNSSGFRVNIGIVSNNKYSLFCGTDPRAEVNKVCELGTMVNLVYEQSANLQTLTIDDVSASKTDSAAARNKCYLFSYYGGSRYYAPGRARHAKITNNGEVVRDMWSCYRISDSVAGMWDKVSETFFVNAGSGTFAVGPDV